MPRAAGSSSYYELAIIDGAGNPKGRTCKLPGVTSILKALPKGGLEYWGMKLGVEGTLHWLSKKHEEGALEITKEVVEQAYTELKEGKEYHPYHVMKKAGERGTDIHDIAEVLLTTGEMPPRSSIPDEKVEYARALWRWYNDKKIANYKVIAVEEPVFSLEHRFAGTLDAILYDPVLDAWYPLDFKTSKGIYEAHLLQIAAYDFAAKERGWMPTDAVSFPTVVRLGADGMYETKQSDCDECGIEDFLAVKKVWEFLEKMKGGVV